MDHQQASLDAPLGELGATTLHGLFADAVRRRPQAAALVAEDATLSYADLDARAAALARTLLRRLGPLPLDGVIGLHAGRNSGLLAGLLAILKAGAAYLPLEPTYPAERLAFMAQDSGTVAVLSDDPGAADLFRLPDDRVIGLHEGDAVGPPPPERSAADDLAYVIYTSGSSGRPKGVAVPHRGVCNMALAHRAMLRIGPDDRVLLFASIAFDATLAEIFPAFAAGAALHLTSEAERHSPDRLHHYLRTHRIGVATLMASVMSALPREQLPDLHALLLAGETPTQETLSFWSHGRLLFNAYGPTEASVSSCANLYRPGDPPNRIGRALPNTLLYVVDEAGREVAVGESGELLIGGIGVARGYLGQPALTAERFTANPFGPGRLYRSGDRVRRATADELDYLGRLDFQVKVGGVRIEPDEVARALERLPGVRQGCVLAIDQAGGKVLVACYVAEGTPPSEGTLSEALAGRLPAAMVPARFLAVDRLPLTNSGKVDRAELVRIATAAMRTADPPASPTEREVAQLWCEALKLPAVSRDDNFYALGGDSLRLNWLIQKLNQRYGTRLVANRFRQLTTLADLARHIDHACAERSVEEF